MVYKGVKIALQAPDRHGTYLAFGLTLVIGLQAMINGAVVMGLLPTKGLPLPLISYGGSSLITTMASVGILLNISGSVKEQPQGFTSAKRSDRGGRGRYRSAARRKRGTKKTEAR